MQYKFQDVTPCRLLATLQVEAGGHIPKGLHLQYGDILCAVTCFVSLWSKTKSLSKAKVIQIHLYSCSCGLQIEWQLEKGNVSCHYWWNIWPQIKVVPNVLLDRCKSVVRYRLSYFKTFFVKVIIYFPPCSIILLRPRLSICYPSQTASTSDTCDGLLSAWLYFPTSFPCLDLSLPLEWFCSTPCPHICEAKSCTVTLHYICNWIKQVRCTEYKQALVLLMVVTSCYMNVNLCHNLTYSILVKHWILQEVIVSTGVIRDNVT